MSKAGAILAVTASIAVIAGTIYAFNKKPPVALDANGFPTPAKEGDKFTKGGKSYTYHNGVWTTDEGGTPNDDGGSGSSERNKHCWECIAWDKNENCVQVHKCKCNECSGKYGRDSEFEAMMVKKDGTTKQGNCPDYTNKATVVPVPPGSFPIEVEFDIKHPVTVNYKCAPCIQFRGYTYNLIATGKKAGYTRCYYRR